MAVIELHNNSILFVILRIVNSSIYLDSWRLIDQYNHDGEGGESELNCSIDSKGVLEIVSAARCETAFL